MPPGLAYFLSSGKNGTMNMPINPNENANKVINKTVTSSLLILTLIFHICLISF